jgi:thiamine-phosphate pyrophosphorylase
MTALPRLYTMADASFGDPVLLARELLAGGARIVQLRNKVAATGVVFAQAREIVRMLPAGAMFLVNDRADVARLAQASGVHLGQDDLQPPDARKMLAHGQMIGYSTHNLAQALAAEALPVDYIGVGPIFQTSTKEGAGPPVGLRGLQEICARVTKPVVAIGGISLDTALDVIACGAASVAVIRSLLESQKIAVQTRAWLDRLQEN